MPGTRQRFIEASDTEREGPMELARLAGKSVSRFLIRKATAREAAPVAVLRRAMREILILSSLEEYRTRGPGAGELFDQVVQAVDSPPGEGRRSCSSGRPGRGQQVAGAAAGGYENLLARQLYPYQTVRV